MAGLNHTRAHLALVLAITVTSAYIPSPWAVAPRTPKAN